MPGMIQDQEQERSDAERPQAERQKSETRNNTSHCHADTRDQDSLRSCELIAQITYPDDDI